jgi:hypothetical protein
LELIYDMAKAKLEPLTRPDVPRSPLFDGRLSRGNKGFTWMSEMTLRDLEWWEAKKRESASGGGEYAEKDAKTAQTLAAWITWRRLFPHEPWSGKRGEDRTTAAVPNGNPTLHPWGPRNQGGKQAPQAKPKAQEEDLDF